MTTVWLSTGGWVIVIIIIVVFVAVVVGAQLSTAFMDRLRGRAVSSEKERVEQPMEAKRRWRR